MCSRRGAVLTTTAGVIGDGLVVVDQNGAAISAGLNAAAATMERSQREHDAACTQALPAGRPQTAAPSRTAAASTAAAPAQTADQTAATAQPTTTGAVVCAGSTVRAPAPREAQAGSAPPVPPVAAAASGKGSPSSREGLPPVSMPVRPHGVAWGPKGLEAVAVCRQSTKSGKLERAQCNAYRRGHALGYGDNDGARRCGPSIARRSCICPANPLGDGRCTTPYSAQDRGS